MCNACSANVRGEAERDQQRASRANVALTMLARASGATSETERAFDVVAHCEEAEPAIGLLEPALPAANVTQLLQYDDAVRADGAV